MTSSLLRLKRRQNGFTPTPKFGVSLHGKRGFTLVELLVVIAVIAILFAVILIAINPAQRFKDSRNTRRLSDVRSISDSVSTYVTDRKGTFPVDIPDGQCIGSKPATLVATSSPTPRALWRFDNNTNDAMATYNGTTSDTYLAAKFSQGLNINAQIPQGGMSVGDSSIDDAATNALTVEAWVKLNSSLSSGGFDHHQAIFDKGNARLQFSSDSGRLEWEVEDSSFAWNTQYTSTIGDNLKGINAFAEYKDVLYAGAETLASQARMIQKTGNNWSILSGYPSGSESVNALESYNGKLYSGETDGGVARIRSFDGSVWQDVSPAGGTVAGDVLSLARFRGKLYAGIGSASGASVWAYDGVTWSISRQFVTTEALAVFALTVFQGKLYAGTGAGSGPNPSHVFEYSGTAWSGTTMNFVRNRVHSLVTYDGSLYIGLGGVVNSSDGEVYQWTGVGVPTILAGVYHENMLSLAVFNGFLYGGFSGNIAGEGIVRIWTGSVWVSSSTTAGPEVRSMYVYHGQLFAGTRGNAVNEATIQAYANNGYVESVRDIWQPNVWYHVAGVYDGAANRMTLFVNGSVEATAFAAPAGFSENALPLRVGRGFGSDGLSGVLDDVALFTSAVNQTVIATHAGCYNLAQYIVPEYMGKIPDDPSSTVTDGTDTGYSISKIGNMVTITAPLTETTPTIPDIVKASR